MDNAPLEPLTHLADGIGVDKVSLFIGDQIAASDDKLLRQHRIINVLNCAVNCDINYVDKTLDLTPGGINRVYGYAPIRTAKIGMIDGDGNDPILMFAAVHMLHGMLHQTFPEKKSYPVRQAGNILVHCRGGRSRSVAVAALYLHYMFPQQWPSLENLIDEIRHKRGIPQKEFDRVPTPGILHNTVQVYAMLQSGKALFGP
jgi:myo-inositol-1(or 4)-monophosphatase